MDRSLEIAKKEIQIRIIKSLYDMGSIPKEIYSKATDILQQKLTQYLRQDIIS
jgi:uncharacterized protein YqgQ